jgi:hypothetical protein
MKKTLQLAPQLNRRQQQKITGGIGACVWTCTADGRSYESKKGCAISCPAPFPCEFVC